MKLKTSSFSLIRVPMVGSILLFHSLSYSYVCIFLLQYHHVVLQFDSDHVAELILCMAILQLQ